MSASTSSTAPNTALYVKNIPSKIKKQELRRQLYCLFVTYGKVLDVVATRASGMRSQAFIVFQDLASSTAALRALDGFTFYGQALTLDYAKSKSKATIVAEKGPEALFDPDIVASLKKSKVTFSSAGADLQGRERKRAREEAGQRGEVRIAADSDESSEEERDADGPPDVKRRKSEASANGKEGDESEEEENEMQLANSDDDEEKDASAELGPPIPMAGEVPNNLLFCGDLPDEASDEMLGVLFQQYPGFRTIQLLPPKQGRTPPSAFAFVEFASTEQAAAAIKGLQHFKLAPENFLNVAYAARRAAA